MHLCCSSEVSMVLLPGSDVGSLNTRTLLKMVGLFQSILALIPHCLDQAGCCSMLEGVGAFAHCCWGEQSHGQKLWKCCQYQLCRETAAYLLYQHQSLRQVGSVVHCCWGQQSHGQNLWKCCQYGPILRWPHTFGILIAVDLCGASSRRPPDNVGARNWS